MRNPCAQKSGQKAFILFYFLSSESPPRESANTPKFNFSYWHRIFVLRSATKSTMRLVLDPPKERIHQWNHSSTGSCARAPITTPYYLLVPIFPPGLLLCSGCLHERLYSTLHRTEAHTFPAFHLLPPASSALICSSRRLEQ